MSVRYLFNTAGNYVAFQHGNHVFTPNADWLGFLIGGNQLYSANGTFLGYVLEDDRVARNKKEQRPQLGPFQRPPMPARPLKPLKPLKRLRKPKLPNPYEDVFEGGIVGAEPDTTSSDVFLDDLIDTDLYAADNKYLGRVNRNPYDINSIAHQYGEFGNSFSVKSILNKYGPYGSPYSGLSPYNEFSRTPPRFVKNGKILAYLTANQFIGPRVDPTEFLTWLGR